MSLFPRNSNESNYIGGQKHFLEDIKNEDMSRHLLWVNPDLDFNDRSVLTVNPSEEALFIKDGDIVGTFSHGRYVLESENYPFLSRIRNAVSGGRSTYHSTVVFVRTIISDEVRWGTSSDIIATDPVSHQQVRLQARGSFQIKVEDAALFYTNLVGNNNPYYDESELMDKCSGIVVQEMSDAVSEAILSAGREAYTTIGDRRSIAKDVQAELQDKLDQQGFGIKLQNFAFRGLDYSPEDTYGKAIAQNSYLINSAYGQAASDNYYMNTLGANYERKRRLDIVQDMANNSDGMAATGAGLGMGIAAMSVMGGMAMNTLENATQTAGASVAAAAGAAMPGAAAAPAAAAANAPAATPAGTAASQGVTCPSCGSVMPEGARFCLNCGSKLETPPVDTFCLNCGAKIPAGGKFCMSCGTPVKGA